MIGMAGMAVALVATVVAVKVLGETLDLGGLGIFAVLVAAMVLLVVLDRVLLRRAGRRP